MKNINKIILGAFSLMLGLIINAQDYHVDFKKQPKWKKVLKMAKAQNKPIFVDAYTTWCGPCKIMDKNVFTDKNAANFFNENFINIKMDMEKGEGNQLKLDWDVKAFPTFLYFNPNGEIVHRVVGAYEVDQFLNYSKLALDENTTAANLQKRYDAGERGAEFMYSYLVSLRFGYHKELETQVATSYLNSLSNKDLLKKENWNVIKHFMKDPTSKEFQYLVNNQDKLAKILGDKEVDDKFYKTIDKQIQTWSYWYGDKPFETEKEANLIAFLQQSNYEKSSVLLGKILANKYKRLEDKGQYLNTLDYIVKFNLAEGSAVIVNYAKNVIGSYSSEIAWAKALEWLNIADKKEKRVEHRAAILEAKSEVLSKLGNKTEAELAALAAKKADERAEKEGTKIHTVPMMKMTGMTPKKN